MCINRVTALYCFVVFLSMFSQLQMLVSSVNRRMIKNGGIERTYLEVIVTYLGTVTSSRIDLCADVRTRNIPNNGWLYSLFSLYRHNHITTIFIPETQICIR
jgi:hypothetical protein